MPFKWTEDIIDQDYKFNFTYTDSVKRCRDCCIGGPLFSTNFVYDQSIQMTCNQGLKVFYCHDNPRTIDLLTYPCEETQLVQYILIDNVAPANVTSSVASSAVVGTGTRSATSVAPASTTASVPSSASQLNVSLILPVLMLLLYFHILNRVK